MKKLLFLFAVLLGTVGAWAQPETGKFYYLQNQHDSYIIYADPSTHGLKATASGNLNEVYGSSQLWYLEKSTTEGKYTLRNMSNHYYMKSGDSWISTEDFNDVYIVERTAATGEKPTYYNISSNADASGNTCLHGWANQLDAKSWSSEGGGSQFAFVPVEFEKDVIYNWLYVKETELIDYASKIHNGNWENNSNSWYTSVVVDDYVSVTLSTDGNYIGYSTKEGLKRPYLQAGKEYTISIPEACKITEYKIVTQSTTKDNQSKFKYTTSEGMGTSPTQTTSNQEIHVTGLNTSSITLDLSEYSQSGTHGIILYNIYIKYKYEEAEFTYSFKLEGEEVRSETILGIVGMTFPEYTLPAYYAYTQKEGTITAEDRGKTFEFNITSTLPFTLSENFANATWYYMNIRGTKMVSHSETLPYSNTQKEQSEDVYGQWAFMGNPFDGIQILNKGAGAGYTLGYASAAGDSDVYMKEGTTTWTIEEGNAGFAFHINNTNMYVHDLNSKLRIWNNDGAKGDNGSAFTVEAVQNDVFYQHWGNHYPWTTDVVTKLPDNLSVCQYSEEGKTHTIKKAETKINALGGDMTVSFTYVAGSHMLMIAGVDLIKDGKIVKKDYHEGKAGEQHSGHEYTLSGVEAGEYTLRYFVCEKTSGQNSHSLNSTQGFIKVTGATLPNIDVTYKYTLEGKELTNEGRTYSLPVGSKYPEVNEFPYGIVAIKPAGCIVTKDIVSGAVTKTIELQEELPFVKSADLATAKWYLVDMHSNDNGNGEILGGSHRYIWTYNSEGAYNVQLPIEATKQTALFGDEKLWCFVGNAYDGFKIYNKAAGKNLTLNKPEDENTLASMSDVANATSYHLVNSDEFDGATCFRPVGHTYYLNTQPEEGIKILKGWNNTSGGSCCRFFAPTDFVLESIKHALVTPGGAIGASVVWTKDAAKTIGEAQAAILADAWSVSAITAEVTDILNALQTSVEVIPMTPGYYFIKGTGTGNNVNWYVTYGSNTIDFIAAALGNNEKLSAKHVWKFDEISGENGYKIMATNTGKYAQLSAAAATSKVDSDFNNGFKFVLTDNGQAKFTIKDGSNNVMRTENDGRINYWGSENNETWYIIPATELDITISSAGWATTCLPFDVVLPEDLTAYSITDVTNADETEGSVTLTSKIGIKANQGALLKGNEGTYTLSIEETISDWSSNKLSGTTVAKDLSTVDGDVYLLVADGQNSAKLSKLVLESGATDAQKTLAANKAYLNIPTGGSPARFLVFNFDDDNETGITDMETGNLNGENNEIYDFSGRRVRKVQKGLYIVNGKKVVY